MGMRCFVGPQFMPKLMPTQFIVDRSENVGTESCRRTHRCDSTDPCSERF